MTSKARKETNAVAETTAKREDNGVPDEWPYRFEIVPLEHLVVDEAYQRPLGRLVKEIGENYDPALIGTAVVNERKRGTLALIDGQHRKEGSALAGKASIPAVVFEGLSRAQEAQLFSDLQTKRRNITSLQRYKARLAAQQPQAKEIRRIAEETGWDIGLQEYNALRAIAALDKLYQRGPDVLRRTLFVAKRAWPNQPAKDAAHGSILNGLGRFIAENDPEDARLITRLAATTPQEVRFKADAMRQGRGSGSAAVYVTDVITSIYTRRATATKEG